MRRTQNLRLPPVCSQQFHPAHRTSPAGPNLHGVEAGCSACLARCSHNVPLVAHQEALEDACRVEQGQGQDGACAVGKLVDWRIGGEGEVQSGRWAVAEGSSKEADGALRLWRVAGAREAVQCSAGLACRELAWGLALPHSTPSKLAPFTHPPTHPPRSAVGRSPRLCVRSPSTSTPAATSRVTTALVSSSRWASAPADCVRIGCGRARGGVVQG